MAKDLLFVNQVVAALASRRLSSPTTDGLLSLSTSNTFFLLLHLYCFLIMCILAPFF